MAAQIRRAKTEDARGIHDAHMRSINEVCSRDHSPEEIAAWGGRPFREDQRINAINNNFVWVVEIDGQIQGYALLSFNNDNDRNVAHIGGLYLTPEVNGYG